MQRDQLVEQYLEVTTAMQTAWRSYFMKLLVDERMSPAQIGLMAIIKNKQPVSGRDLAEHMRITRSAITQLTDGLDALGYIERKEDKNDRRIVYITLSAAGEERFQLFEKKRRSLYKTLAERLTDEELHALITTHTKLIQEIETLDKN